jgi:hypothetical protein
MWERRPSPRLSRAGSAGALPSRGPSPGRHTAIETAALKTRRLSETEELRPDGSGACTTARLPSPRRRISADNSCGEPAMSRGSFVARSTATHLPALSARTDDSARRSGLLGTRDLVRFHNRHRPTPGASPGTVPTCRSESRDYPRALRRDREHPIRETASSSCGLQTRALPSRRWPTSRSCSTTSRRW